MLASIEVLHELKKKDDDVYGWAKDRKESLFVEIDAGCRPRSCGSCRPTQSLWTPGKESQEAIPFVIAQALAHNPRLVIVTQEAGGSADNPKFPRCLRQHHR
ncbi:DUF4411 domain-containing protein, partial [Amaricoccus sp. HAR-UPW-R2A-40]